VTNWQTRLNDPVPVVCKRMHRVFWVPRRYRAAIAVALQGPFTMRDMAARTGYSLHGAWAAFDSIRAMGIGTARSTRGRLGRTRFTLSSDASVGNVPSTVTTLVRTMFEPVAVEGTFRPTWDAQAYTEEVTRKMKAMMGLKP
jgi:hypothetical protein